MMVLEREFKGILGINSYYIDGHSDQLNLLSAIGGRALKSIDEMQHERIYTAGHLSDDGWDMRTVGCTFRGLTTDCQITVALYSGAGQLLAVRCVAAGEDFAERTVSLTAQTKDGLRLRAFAWDRGKGCAPICEALIDETVA